MLCSVQYVRLVNVTQIEHTFGSACISVNRQIIQVAHCVLKDHSNWLMVWFIDFLYISIHATCLVWILLHCCIFPSLGMASITLFFIFFSLLHWDLYIFILIPWFYFILFYLTSFVISCCFVCYFLLVGAVLPFLMCLNVRYAINKGMI